MLSVFLIHIASPMCLPDEDFRREVERSITKYVILVVQRVINIVFVSTWWNFSYKKHILTGLGNNPSQRRNQISGSHSFRRFIAGPCTCSETKEATVYQFWRMTIYLVMFNRTLQLHCKVQLLSWCRLSVCMSACTVTRVYCGKTTKVRMSWYSLDIRQCLNF